MTLGVHARRYAIIPQQVLFYCADGVLYELAEPYEGNPVVAPTPGPSETPPPGGWCSQGFLASDSSGNVYLLDAQMLQVFQEPYSAAPATTRPGFPLTSGAAFAVDSSENVLECSKNEPLYESSPPYSSAARLPDNPMILCSGSGGAIDVVSNEASVAVAKGGEVDIYNQPYSSYPEKLPVTAAADSPTALAISLTGEIALASSESEYFYDGPSGSLRALTNAASAHASQFDNWGDLYVGEWTAPDAVVEFQQPISVASPVYQTFSLPVHPIVIRVDDAGDVLIGTTSGLYEVPANSSSAVNLPLVGSDAIVDMALGSLGGGASVSR